MIATNENGHKTKPGRASAPIKWHGGKFYLAARILDAMPEHRHYVETHFGGGAVLFRKPTALIAAHSEVVNDIDAELTNFWRTLQDESTFSKFKRIVEATPFSKDEWCKAAACDAADSIERAVSFFVRYRQSRQGLGRDFATMSRTRTRRGMNEQASSWWSAVEGLQDAHERLRRVVIVNDDACELIRREDGPATLFYCDPPYVCRTRVVGNAYRHEMTEADHSRLLETLGSVQGRFLLSGYNDPLYSDAEQRYGWRRMDVVIDNKASGQKRKPMKIESIWMNF